jgi:Zn-dependent protease with chaperone function
MNSLTGSSLLRWGLGAVYLGLCFLPLLLLPDWVSMVLLPPWLGIALWSYLTQESYWGRVKPIRPLSRWDLPDWERFQGDVAAAVERSGLRREPLWAVLPEDEPNAMAVGTPRGMVILSRGLLQRFPQEEITAIIGHELSHLASRDSLPAFMGGSFLHLLALISYQSRVGARQVGRNLAALPFQLVSLVIDLFLVTVGRLAEIMFAQRSRAVEHRADLVGAQLTSAGAMISALERLGQVGSHWYEAPRWSGAWVAQKLHASHPPLPIRIRFLQEAVERGEVHV